MATSNIELDHIRVDDIADHKRRHSSINRQPAANESVDVPSISAAGDFALPPADGGRQAWLFLAGCFLMEGLVWGKKFQVYASQLKAIIALRVGFRLIMP